MLTSVAAEDLLIHDGGDGQAVEAVGKSLPQLDVEPAFTCGIKREFRPRVAAPPTPPPPARYGGRVKKGGSHSS